MPDYGRISPTVLHLAVLSADLAADVLRLVAAGATLLSGPETSGGNHFAMLRDPWDMPCMARCAEPMLE